MRGGTGQRVSEVALEISFVNIYSTGCSAR